MRNYTTFASKRDPLKCAQPSVYCQYAKRWLGQVSMQKWCNLSRKHTTSLCQLPADDELKLHNLGAGTKIRTRDLLITNQLLYQLSYTGNKKRGGVF